MEPINASTIAGPSSAANSTRSFGELGSDDFLKLLITQLQAQDPLEPMGNQELLDQISSIREIELSTTLTASLRDLTGQGRFSSASSFIGQFVTSMPNADGQVQQGVVVGVRFAENDQVILQLAGGRELALDQVSQIESPMQAAETMVGQGVIGVDRRNLAEPRLVQGVVTGVRQDETQEILLELDTGEDLRFRDVLSVVSAEGL